MKIHGKEYTEVKDRIPVLFEQHPEASIETFVLWHSEDFAAVCIRAVVMVGERNFSGLAYEERVGGVSNEVNASSWVENAETSAIGRALANMNIGVQGARPSAEEMQKVERMKKAPPKFSENFTMLQNSLDDVLTGPKNLEDLKEWWKQYADIVKDLPENEKNIITKLKDERKKEMQNGQ